MYNNGYPVNKIDSFDYSLRSMDGQNIDENSSAINISDVIEVIETDPAFGSMESRRQLMQPEAGARLVIIEQPASKALRFRYECEGRSAGSIPGVNSTAENKTYPAVQIVGFKGRAMVLASCVTKDTPYRAHPHKLVGKDGCKRGICTVEVNSENMIATFANLGIQCVKKKEIEEALKIREEIRVDPFRAGFGHVKQPGSIDLNSVRLCFQAFLEGPQRGKFVIPLPPVVSEPIYDKKAMADLVICKLSHCSAPVAGGLDVILLCEKVAKEDIEIWFYEEQEGQVIWESRADITPAQVHKQVAIHFRTPKYINIEIDHPVNVFIQLRRPSDNAASKALPFKLTPLDSDPGQNKRKRQKFSMDTEQIRVHLPDNSPSLSVKREPAEMSPHSYNLLPNNVRSYYASRTPSPHLEFARDTPGAYPGPSSVYTQAVYPSMVSPSAPLLSPGIPQLVQETQVQPTQPQQIIYQQPVASSVSDNTGLSSNNVYVDMDTQQYSDLPVMWDVGLSENLSANLTLEERTDNMTDSLTNIVNTKFNDLCQFSDNVNGPN